MEWAYIAGIIDGEGCLTILCRRRKERVPTLEPVLRIVNTNREALDKIGAFLGGWVTTQHIPKRPNEHTLYVLSATGRENIKWILENCLPFLIIKRNQAIVLLQFVTRRLKFIRKGLPRGVSFTTEEDFELYKKIALLNRKYHGKGKGPIFSEWSELQRLISLNSKRVPLFSKQEVLPPPTS